MTENQRKEQRDQRRLDIAISLLQGKIIEKPRDGYDPAGFYSKSLASTIGAALDMAEELIIQNEAYDEKENT